MVTVGLYIYIDGVAKRIELFDDEKISLNSSVQNASDISKIYTDFSQSFTVPASERNNRIFSHWYENAIDGGYDARKRKKAYIELDTIPFRNGNIQLEKATIKNGAPQNYTITFFGTLVSLKDTFAGKKLSELDFSAYNIPYSPANVIDRVSAYVTEDVKFPLISSKRVWQDTGTTENITTSGGAILFNELFPALRVSKVFDTIASNYGITFDGRFLSDERFTNSFLWLKNSETFAEKSENLKIDFQTQTPTGAFNGGWTFNVTTDKLKYQTPNTFVKSKVSFSVTSTVLNVPYDVLVYKNGEFKARFPAANVSTATNVFNLFLFETESTDNDGEYEFYIQSSAAITFTSVMTVQINVTFGYTTSLTIRQTTAQTTSSTLNISNYMPDMKVEDFFSGVLKMFNLTCLGYEENVYTIEQLEDWYSVGKIIDITKHVIYDNIEISKSDSFKKINFNYNKSESLMNVAYSSNNGFEYGDLKADLNADGGEYKVELPFENILFNKFTGQDLQVGYALQTDLSSYIPKPVILYDYNTLQASNFFMKGTGSAVNVDTYNLFGQDTLINSINYSLNFGAEISSFLLEPITNSLYAEYYQKYLESIYSQKSRKVNVKCIFPISLLTSVKLNNRFIIRDKRYIINNMKIDLTTGEVDLELINDFRIIVPEMKINSVTRIDTSSVSVDFSSETSGNCSATQIEHSFDNINWNANTGSCTSPRTISISPDNQGTIYFRIKKFYTFGGSSEYSNVFILPSV